MSTINTEEFKYFAVNTRTKWREGFGDAVIIDERGQLTLAPRQDLTPFDEVEHATGIAVSRRGDLFVIDAKSCRIHRYTLRDEKWTPVLCFGGCGSAYGRFAFSSGAGNFSGGLAFGKSTLYVADTYNHRLQAFYLPGWQIKFVLGKEHHCAPVSGAEPGAFNAPKDLAVDSKGNLYVLDYGNNRIQKFNRFGGFVWQIAAADKVPRQKFISLAIDAENFLYVVDADKATVEKFDANGQWLATVIKFKELPRPIPPIGMANPKDFSWPIQPAAIAVDHNRIISIGESGSGDKLSIHQFDLTGRYLGRLGRYPDSCFKLVADDRGRLYGSCGAEGRVFFFGSERQFEREGAYYSKRFDSTITGCQWHRLALEVQPAEKTTLEVFFHASDTIVERVEIEKQEAWRHLLSAPFNAVQVRDALFRQATGRYLQLKLQFFGEGFQTLTVKEAQIFFQRLSYLRYLPATYQEDEKGKDFLERFLSIFETMSFEVEQQINQIARYFDPQVVDGEFLQWLGSWLALTRDENWPERKRKKLLAKAFQLYKARGTARGLKEMINLLTDGRVAIIEHYRLRRPMVLGANATVGATTVVGKRFPPWLILEESSGIGEFKLNETADPPEKPFEAGAFDFTILADTSRLEDENELRALRRLVDEEKPAHTRAFLRTSQNAAMQLGVHALLEVDTKLSRGFKPMRLGHNSRVGRESFVGARYRRKGRLGMRSKIGVDTILN